MAPATAMEHAILTTTLGNAFQGLYRHALALLGIIEQKLCRSLLCVECEFIYSVCVLRIVAVLVAYPC